MSDIIQQLNECAKVCQDQRMVGDAYVMTEAAAEITRLRARIEAADKLEEAVKHERGMACQDIGMQLAAFDAVDAALTAYKETVE